MENKEHISTLLKWGRVPLTEEDGQSNFVAIGSTGSGKTIVIRLLMQSVLPDVGKGLGHRALIYDAKHDLMPILSAYVNRDCIKTFHPYDTRGVSWHISKDVQDSATAIEFVFAIVPETSSDSNPFFRNATRHIAWGVVMSFILSKLDWSFADLLRALRSEELCKRILRRHSQTSFLARQYLREPKLASDIFATIASAMMLYEPVASSWEHAPERLSIRDCIERELIVILGNAEVGRVATERINCVLCKLWSDQVLAQPEYTSNTYWGFFDELSEAGPLTHLASFAKKARSKGGRLCIAYQSIAGLQNPKLYGQFVTDDMMSNFANRFIGRLECPTTAAYVSNFIGEQEVEQRSRTSSSGSKGSNSVTYSNVTKKTVLPSELMAMQHCGSKSGLTGLFKLRSTDPYWDKIDAKELFGSMLIPKAHDVPEFIPRSGHLQLLEPWSKEQIEHFAPRISRQKDSKRKNEQAPGRNLQSERDDLDDLDLYQ